MGCLYFHELDDLGKSETMNEIQGVKSQLWDIQVMDNYQNNGNIYYG